MKGNFVKVIILLVVAFFAYKFLSQGIKSFSARPKASVPTEQVPPDAAPENGLPAEPANNTPAVTGDKPEAPALLNNYERVPFISVKKSKTETPEKDTRSQSAGYKTPQLTTILNYEGKWFAIVNGNLVKAGDKMGKIKILEIKENWVSIEEDGRTTQLKLWQEAGSK